MTNLTNQQIIVTGSNVGIGYETALALAKMGAGITMVCRSEERGEAARQTLIEKSGSNKFDLIVGDLASHADIKRIASEYKARHARLDVLVNNAGAAFLSRKLTVDGFERTFGLNHLNYFLLTYYLLDLLNEADAGRIVNVASAAHYGGEIDFDDLQMEKNYASMKAYSNSKLANVLFTSELARRLEASGSKVIVNSLHPGVVKSNIGRRDNSWIAGIFMTFFQMRAIPTAEGAKTSIYLASSPNVEGVTGKYFDESKEKTPSKAAQDEALASRLWQVSEELSGVSYSI